MNTIAFGSCIRQDEPQPIWDAVVDTHPDLFLFLGDNIYADTEDMSVMRQKYVTQSEQPGIRKLFASAPVMATWDDHDYGRDDAGAEYPMKSQAQREFLRFFAVPQTSARWQRPGVYNARAFGPPGKRVQVIMLDTRYFRSPLQRWADDDAGRSTGGPYKASGDSTATVLGEAQWAWLEDQLSEPAAVRIIGTSIQAIPSQHGYESWSNFPLERDRLFALIRETGAAGVILVSGDRHLAEISRLPASDADGVGYPIFEITSSSLNRPSGTEGTEPNRYRVQASNYKAVNFGALLLDWNAADPVITMQVRDVSGSVVLESVAQLSELQPAGS